MGNYHSSSNSSSEGKYPWESKEEATTTIKEHFTRPFPAHPARSESKVSFQAALVYFHRFLNLRDEEEDGEKGSMRGMHFRSDINWLGKTREGNKIAAPY